MSRAVKYIFCTCNLLKPKAQYTNLINFRHLPRWSHRRPIRIVENDVTEEEKNLWKLKVEGEVVGSLNKTSNDNANLNTSETLSAERENVSVSKAYERKISYSVNDNMNSKEDTFQKHKLNLTYSNSEHKNEKSKFSTHFSGNLFSSNISKKSSKSNYIGLKAEESLLKLKESAFKLGVPEFCDLGTNDTVLSQYMINVKSRKRREKTGIVLLEGKRLIQEAVSCGIVPTAVFFSRINDLKNLDLPHTGVKIYKITYKQICKWSDVTTPPGLLAIMPTPDISKRLPSVLPLTVICDNVRDPGNMGSILRTCAALGCQQVILTKGCVDLWEPKVVRSSAGAHFRVSVKKDVTWSDVMSIIDDKCSLFIAENNPLPNVLEAPQHSITNDHSNADADSKSGDSNKSESYLANSSKSVDLKSNVPLPPAIPYYSYTYSCNKSLVLIVGGETEGISFNAYKLISQTNGVRLNIPLSNGVESLNVGTALGIIGFEMKKQFLMNSLDGFSGNEETFDSHMAVSLSQV